LIKPVAKFFNAGGDFIELDRLTAAVAFDYEHVIRRAEGSGDTNLAGFASEAAVL
jgi:hypothetical protein